MASPGTQNFPGRGYEAGASRPDHPARHSGGMRESSAMDGSPRLLWRWPVHAPVQQTWCRPPACPPWYRVPASCRDDGLRSLRPVHRRLASRLELGSGSAWLSPGPRPPQCRGTARDSRSWYTHEELDDPQALALAIDQSGQSAAQGASPVGPRVPAEQADAPVDDAPFLAGREVG
jgi:hypothetical protein